MQRIEKRRWPLLDLKYAGSCWNVGNLMTSLVTKLVFVILQGP